MVDFDLEWVRDNDGLDRFVAEIYAAADADFRAAVSLEDYRHQFEQGPVVLGRRNGDIVAWVQICERRKEDEQPGRRVAFHAADEETACLAQLLLMARADSAADGIYWAATTGDIQERIAADVGATVRQDLFGIWQAPRHRWRSLDDLPPASTVQVRAPLPDTLLSQYAQFYTTAGVKQCGEAGCTTIWDEAMIAEEMARRDASLYTEALLGAKGLTAEAYAFTWRDGMCISLTHRDAGSAELSTLIASLLQRVHTIDPVIGTAMFHLDDEDVATVGPALVEAGFEETGRRAIYHLLPDTEPATVPG